jgi:hypothetical protein
MSAKAADYLLAIVPIAHVIKDTVSLSARTKSSDVRIAEPTLQLRD